MVAVPRPLPPYPITLTPAEKIKSARLAAPVTFAALHRAAAAKTEPHQQDEKSLLLEAAGLIERLLALVPNDVFSEQLCWRGRPFSELTDAERQEALKQAAELR